MTIKVKIEKEGFILTKENARYLKSLFALLGYEKYDWIEFHLDTMIRNKGRDYMIYCTNKTIRNNIEEYINDNNIRCEGTGSSNSSIPE